MGLVTIVIRKRNVTKEQAEAAASLVRQKLADVQNVEVKANFSEQIEDES